MRLLFTAIAFGFVFLFALILSNVAQQKIELIPKPTYASVIIQDGRSMCEKNSEMNLIEAWEKKCEESGEDKSCALPKKDVSPMFQYKAWSTENCLTK